MSKKKHPTYSAVLLSVEEYDWIIHVTAKKSIEEGFLNAVAKISDTIN